MLSVCTAQQVVRRSRSWWRPRWTRDFMPDTEMPVSGGGTLVGFAVEIDAGERVRGRWAGADR